MGSNANGEMLAERKAMVCMHRELEKWAILVDFVLSLRHEVCGY